MRHERGFSLVELMVAMTITLVISSAIYGLLTAGSNAFRREPELADRQQNIRVAMDIIARDVFGAGAGLPTFGQMFTRNDPGGACQPALNGCGQPGTMGPGAAAARGADSQNTDVLQILSADEQCPSLAVCSAGPAAGAAGVFVTETALPQSQCIRAFRLLLLTNDRAFTVQAATAAGNGVTCPAGGVSPPNANLTLTATLAPFVPLVVFPANNPDPPAANSVYLHRARLVRYRIAPSTAAGDVAPALWRTESGLFNGDGTPAPEPGVAGFSLANSPWELIARGIEDLDGNGAWQNQPPVALLDDWNSIVRRVRISLSARATAPNLAGETSAGGGAPVAVRGELSTVVTPRAAYNDLRMCTDPTDVNPIDCTPAQRIQ
jgi:prepilin-type N-terminal cleavage/methylation domain-containing protein